MATGNIRVRITVRTSAYRRLLRRATLVLTGWARAIAHPN